MAKRRRIISLLLTVFFITPLIEVKVIEIPSAEPRKIDCVENSDLRSYAIKQVEDNARVQKQKLERIEREKTEEQAKLEEIQIEEQKKNRIYCKFEVSFYTTSADEGSGTGLGASGEYVQPWVSVALPKDIPFYSTAYIEGLGQFINHDSGSYIGWAYDEEGNLVCRVDVCVSTKDEAFNLGRLYSDGYIDIEN